MAERRIFSCDVCGTEQGQTNHWFAIVIEARMLTLVPMTGHEYARTGVETFHLCGEKCVIRKVNEFLGVTKR